jgi:hypothetical protein
VIRGVSPAALFGVAGILAAAGGVGCAGPRQQAVIEPGSSSSTTGSPGQGADDRAFVLSRKSAGPTAPASIQVNIGERWWKFRSDYLKLNEQQVRARDSDVSEVMAPEKFWDEQTSVEAIAVWTAVCNECHGGRRRLEDVTAMPIPTAEWGRGEGLFFGARRRYADVFATIYRGGPERRGVRSEMPAWRGKIAKELIWALLYFLEYQSGGIEGRFPPSLYPRPPNVVE